MRVLLLLTAPCLALGLVGPAYAQQGPPPPPLDLGPLLQRARESKAIDRVLGDRWFHMTSPKGEALLRVRVVAVEDPPSLAFDSLLRTLDRPGAISSQFVLGWDGDMQAFRVGVQAPGEDGTTEGRVEGKKLKLTWTRGEQTREDTMDWHAAAIPAPIAMFVLPSLIDQGLPPDGALFMQFDEQGMRYGARRVRGIRPDPNAGPGLSEVRVTLPSAPNKPQFTAHLSPAGHITQLLRGRENQMRILLIAPELAAKLMDRVVDFVPDPPQNGGSGAGSGSEREGEGSDGSGSDGQESGSGTEDSGSGSEQEPKIGDD